MVEDGDLEIADDVRQAAKALVDHSTAECEARVRETLEVLEALGSEGIRARAFKGLALGQLAYGDATLRPSRDTVVLVRAATTWRDPSRCLRASAIARPIRWASASWTPVTRPTGRTSCLRGTGVSARHPCARTHVVWNRRDPVQAKVSPMSQV
jgi:hypothetical protein